MKLALLFDHFGPYHLARLRAAMRGGEVVGVEFAARSGEYAWDLADRGGLTIHTLRNGGGPDGLDAKLAALKPDVVAVPGWSGLRPLAALRWCLEHRVPAVLMSESTAHDEIRRPLKEAIKRRLVGQFSAALVGGSDHARYVEKLGMPAERVFLGYDAVDNDHFAPGAVQARTSEAGFLASARFIEKKNLPRLLRAYSRYRQMVSPREAWPLVLLGDGPLRPLLESLVAELRLGQAVTMPGFKQYEELPAHYARANAFIHASTTEQWGLVVNEAMAAGLPILVSNRCGCAPDLVAEGVNGFAFDPEDTEAMARSMERMATLPEDRRQTMGEESRKIIADWGCERFAAGLHAAAACALRTGPREVALQDRLIIKALLCR